MGIFLFCFVFLDFCFVSWSRLLIVDCSSQPRAVDFNTKNSKNIKINFFEPLDLITRDDLTMVFLFFWILEFWHFGIFLLLLTKGLATSFYSWVNYQIYPADVTWWMWTWTWMWNPWMGLCSKHLLVEVKSCWNNPN